MEWYVNLCTSNFYIKPVLDIPHWLFEIHPPWPGGQCTWALLLVRSKGIRRRSEGSRKEKSVIFIHSLPPLKSLVQHQLNSSMKVTVPMPDSLQQPSPIPMGGRVLPHPLVGYLNPGSTFVTSFSIKSSSITHFKGTFCFLQKPWYIFFAIHFNQEVALFHINSTYFIFREYNIYTGTASVSILFFSIRLWHAWGQGRVILLVQILFRVMGSKNIYLTDNSWNYFILEVWEGVVC